MSNAASASCTATSCSRKSSDETIRARVAVEGHSNDAASSQAAFDGVNQYLAKLALYAREKAFMKDMPAALLVALSVRDTELMHRVFDRYYPSQTGHTC